MEKISLDELRKILKELGHSDEEIEEVISKKEKEESPKDETEEEVEEKVEVEASPEESPVAEEEGEPAEVEEPSTDESGLPEGEPVVEPEELPMEEAPVEEPVAEPSPEVEAEPLPEGVEEVNPEAPVVEEPAPTEPVDPGVDIQALMNRLDESEKAREGLQARIDELENALKEAGVLGEDSLSHKEVGIDDGTRVNDYHDDEQTFDDILNQINRGY